MKQIPIKFTGSVFFACIFLELAFYVALKKVWIQAFPSFSVLIITTLAALTLALFFFLQSIQKSNPQKFLQRYLLSITIKMVVGCALILVVIFMDREGAMANALFFISAYFFLTAIEIFFLLKGRAIN